jgi:hypothetical protein
MPSLNGSLFIIKLEAKYKFHVCTPFALLFCILQGEKRKSEKIKRVKKKKKEKERPTFKEVSCFSKVYSVTVCRLRTLLSSTAVAANREMCVPTMLLLEPG